jgi:hypothetical protein
VATPFGGGVFIVDASAWGRAAAPGVARSFGAALRAGQIATCAIAALEILQSARDGDDFDARQSQLDALRDVAITRSVTNAALAAYRELAHRHPLFHRSVKLPDLLIAAAAADAGIGVLHYDADFDTLATVLPFESRWIARPGSLH